MLCILLAMVDSPEDKRKVEQLFEQYNNLMLKIANDILNNSHDAEDAVCDSWIKIIENLEKISGIKCNKTKSFIVIVVERTAINLYHKRKRYREVLVDEYEKTPYFITRDKEVEEKETIQWIHSLPKRYSEAVILYYVNEFSYEEIAKILSIDKSTVSRRIFKAKKILQEAMK